MMGSYLVSSSAIMADTSLDEDGLITCCKEEAIEIGCGTIGVFLGSSGIGVGAGVGVVDLASTSAEITVNLRVFFAVSKSS